MKNHFLLLGLLFLTGCSTVGYQTALHNGKVYYIPPQCSKYSYSYSDPDTIHCVHNGVLTGQTLTPADSQQVESYRLQQQANRQAWADLNESLRQSTPKTTNCYNFGYTVSCTTY